MQHTAHGDDAAIWADVAQEAKQLWERAAAADFLSSDLALVLEARALLETPNGTTAAPAASHWRPSQPPLQRHCRRLSQPLRRQACPRASRRLVCRHQASPRPRLPPSCWYVK